MTGLLKRLFLSLLLLVAVTLPSYAETLTVFAAASLRNVMDDAAKAYTAKTGIEIKSSYAASSALAKQIEQGAPADLFASADLEWMDYLAQRKLIKEATRVNLLGNTLVAIAPRDAKLDTLTLDRPAMEAALGPNGKLVTGDPKAVPVGKYARTALENLGLWQAFEPRIAAADNVRSALAFVARGEAPLGIVYATDAAVEPGVKIVAIFPANSHPPVVYPFAVTATGNARSAEFIAFLQTPDMAKAFARAGFSVLAQQRIN